MSYFTKANKLIIQIKEKLSTFSERISGDCKCKNLI